jgi:YD repeat-containing protein
VSYNYYNEHGVVTATKDPKGYSTNYAYGPDLSGVANAGMFPISITNPKQFTANYTYDQYLGQLKSTTDPNNRTTSYTYESSSLQAPSMGRIKEIDYPNGGSMKFNYTDVALGSSVQIEEAQSPSKSTTSDLYVDGFGRKFKSRASDNAGYLYSMVVDDFKGRPQTSFNPTRCDPAANPSVCSGEADTWGSSSFEYDALGRQSKVTHPDGSSISTTYSGNAVESVDERSVTTRRELDAVGQPIDLYEDRTGQNLHTHYSYDTLGNLKTVDQSGTTGETPRSTRTFNYDSLSHLRSSYNPETGPIDYRYDLNGNLHTKTMAAPNGDASSTSPQMVTTTLEYDSLNRLISKAYSGELDVDAEHQTPSVCYQYDSGFDANANPIGRLVAEWTQQGTCAAGATEIPSSAVSWKKGMSYNEVGKLTDELQCPFAPCTSPSPMHYDYDWTNNILHQGNGLSNSQSPQVGWTNSYDNAGRLYKIVSDWTDTSGLGHPATLFKAQGANGASTYGPFGLTAAQYGIVDDTSTVAALSEVRSYDSRGRITQKTVNGGSSSVEPSFDVAVSPNPVRKNGTATLTITTNCVSTCPTGPNYVIDGAYQGGITLKNGTASIPLSTANLSTGPHTLTVNWTYISSPKIVPFEISSDEIPVVNPDLVINPTGTLLYRQVASATTTFGYSDGSGNGNWILDGNFLNGFQYSPANNGSYTLPLQVFDIQAGLHTLGIYLTGDANHPAGTKSVTFTVEPNFTVQLSAPSIQLNGTEWFTVIPNCTSSCGTAYYTVDDVYQFGFGVAGSANPTSMPISTIGFNTGNHTVKVHYPNGGGDVPQTFVVQSPPLAIPPTHVDINPNPVVAGQAATATVTFGYSDGSGNGNWFLDGQYLNGFQYSPSNNGTYTLQLQPLNLAPGSSHTIGIKLSGDATHPQSTNTTPSFTVQ